MVSEGTGNHVLRELALADPGVFEALGRDLEPHPLQGGAVLGAPPTAADSLYFVERGIVSLVASTRSGSSVGVAIVGPEGVAGLADALGSLPLPYRLIVQTPGLAYRAPKHVIREHILSCSSLHGLLMDYSQRVMHQLAQSALCNRFHTSVQRLARWLLFTADRAETNRFELTHEFVAQMVGAPRSAVSEAAAVLREKGIIDYRRGVLTLRKPDRLRRIACECVDVARQPSSSADSPSPSPGRTRRAAR